MLISNTAWKYGWISYANDIFSKMSKIDFLLFRDHKNKRVEVISLIFLNWNWIQECIYVVQKFFTPSASFLPLFIGKYMEQKHGTLKMSVQTHSLHIPLLNQGVLIDVALSPGTLDYLCLILKYMIGMVYETSLMWLTGYDVTLFGFEMRLKRGEAALQ